MASQVFFCIFLFSLHSYIIYARLFESNDKVSSPLEFLNQLSRVQKGNDRKGVNELKKHLSYLGYMNHAAYFHDHENKNVFDDSLKLVLRKYQEYSNLNITGALDANTIAKLCESQSQLPDFYKPNKKISPFHMTSHYSFFSGQPKWPKKGLKYAFNKNVKECAVPQLEHALKQWASSTPFRFYRVANLSQADIKISFMRGYHGDGHPFTGIETGLAHTFAPPDGRVHFDAAQNWSSNAAKEAYDIQTVGLHELGHALGLGHSRTRKAVMFPIICPGETKGLHEDDIKGIKALYKL